MEARWEVTGVGGVARGWSDQATVVESSAAQDDAGAAAAMTRATDQMASYVAATVRLELSGSTLRSTP